MKYEVCKSSAAAWKCYPGERDEVHLEREWESKFPDNKFSVFLLYSGKSSQSPFVREVLQESQVDEDFLNEFYRKAKIAVLYSVHRCTRS